MGAACAVGFGAACAAGFGADALGVECDAGLAVLAVRLGGALAEFEAELPLSTHSKTDGRADDREVEYDREELRDGPRELNEEERPNRQSSLLVKLPLENDIHSENAPAHE